MWHLIFAVGLFSTLGTEGGKFVSKQVEVNQPVVSRVGDIGETIHESEFARSVHQIPEEGMLGGRQFLADNVNLASNTVGLVSSVSCALLCPNMTTCNIPCTPWILLHALLSFIKTHRHKFFKSIPCELILLPIKMVFFSNKSLCVIHLNQDF